jgi:hypothetical protein
MLQCDHFHPMRRERHSKEECNMWSIVWRIMMSLLILALVAACNGALVL